MRKLNSAKTVPKAKDEGQNDLQLLSDVLGDSFFVKENDKGDIIVRSKRDSARIKSVVNGSAHFTKQCEAVDGSLDSGDVLVGAVASLRRIDERVWCVAVIQMVSGARISEVLSLDFRNILANGTIALRGKKRSEDRIVSCGDAWSYLSKCRDAGVHPFEGLNRFYVYRCYKKAGLVLGHGIGSKDSVTHALRHLYVFEAKKVVSTEVIQNQIGHKSINSTNHYVKKGKK